ncbi:cytochrome P450 [Aspergillus keveii]|uniref:Cytochrome P450 n=1 Tax=Aspergillus keveii TaxID=714993 RepID=A0ABR4FTT5_9EURO
MGLLATLDLHTAAQHSLVGALLAGIGWLLLDYARMLLLRRKLPPGPWPLPIVGNHFQTPSVRPWIAWEEWGKYYNSPMLTLWIGRHPRIIINDAWVASDLLEKKADIFSSRPHLIVMGDAINCTTTNQTTLPYGDRWRMHRKLMQALKIMESVNFVIPGLFLMEAIPALMHLPAWLYKLPTALRMGAAIGARYFVMLTEEGAQSKQQSFAKYMLKSQKQFAMSDVEVSGLMANLIGGGVDTTSSTMMSCILALACFPEVQRKAQDDMDRVVGQDRSPSWDDIDHGSLPYLTALVKEVLRWRTVTVLAGIPHANTKDVEYRGYYFPAGTSITGNMWAIHRNPRDFPDPDTFRPERFLGGLENPYPNSRGSNPFGWGRRQCSGQPLAEQGLLFSLGRLIWAFNVQPGLDDKGEQVKLDIFAYTESENQRPEPFRVRFTPRSDKIRQLLLDEAAEARESLRIYDGETKITMEDAAQNPAMV